MKNLAKIKICGLRREEDIQYVNEYIPDYIGFILSKGFRRTVTKEQAAHLRSLLSPPIIPVGVFVNEDIERVIELVQEGVIDVVQLHGDEDENYIKQLRENTKEITIIKAIKIADADDVKSGLQSSADYLLFDKRLENQVGGAGTAFDWNLIKDVKRPFFLAGGIGLENVNLALEATNPYGIDVSSGVETDGYKDKVKIKEIINTIRNSEALIV